jgi:hypothetical protein
MIFIDFLSVEAMVEVFPVAKGIAANLEKPTLSGIAGPVWSSLGQSECAPPKMEGLVLLLHFPGQRVAPAAEDDTC